MAASTCRICGKSIMTAFYCRRLGGTVCERCCRTCRYFEPQFYQCLYFWEKKKAIRSNG